MTKTYISMVDKEKVVKMCHKLREAYSLQAGFAQDLMDALNEDDPERGLDILKLIKSEFSKTIDIDGEIDEVFGKYWPGDEKWEPDEEYDKRTVEKALSNLRKHQELERKRSK